jgi:hypothetical protein
LLALAGCAAEALGPAEYAPTDCRRVALQDSEAGQPIRGAEDLDIDAARGRIFVSAYDRRAVEKAVAQRAFRLPEGGVFAVDLDALLAADGAPAPAKRLVRAGDVAGGLRPHGISYAPDTNEILYLNRAYQKIDGRWRRTTRLERIGGDGEVILGADAPTHCAANDILAKGGGAVASFDHGACDWRASLEDALTLRRSGVAAPTGELLFDAAAFANGIVETADGEIVLAATREKAALFLARDANGYVERRRVPLPGGPDNLTLAPDGSILVAVHPSLFGLAAHRRLGLPRAPTRVVRLTPAGEVQMVFDDRSGARFSAATVAVEWRDALILGSATDEGLLVCRRSS